MSRRLFDMRTSPSSPSRYIPLRLPRVCVAVIGTDAADMFARAESLIRDNLFVEFRLDYLRQPSSAFPRLRKFLETHADVLAVATCRRAVNGGKFRGSASAQAAILVKAANCGCHFVDLEIQSVSALKPAELEKVRRAAALIISSHDFRATRKIDETFARMKAFPAEYYKIVTTAQNLYDNVMMMRFLEHNRDKESVIGLCMGEQGVISRVLGVRAGSAFTFASAGPGEETAPGQVTARELNDTYRIDRVDAATRVYGVAGDPIAQSLSPAMVNMAFRRENVNAVYVGLHAKDLRDLMNCVRDIPINGLSVTMPYKEQIVDLLDNTDALTTKVGACNTVIRAQDGKLYGYNTDVAGVVLPLEQRIHVKDAKVLVIGAGGAARAAVFGLKERGAEVFIINRSAAAGQKLARQAKAKFLNRTAVRKMQFDVIINATPVGMSNGHGAAPLHANELNTKWVMDMVYIPAETPLTKMARAKGIQVISGSEMFVQQGARQFEIWTGKPAPADDMQKVVQTALQARTEAAAAGKKK